MQCPYTGPQISADLIELNMQNGFWATAPVSSSTVDSIGDFFRLLTE